MALVCCSFFSGLRWWDVELQGLECSLVDRDPWSKLRPIVTHDLELSCDGLKLWPRCMLNFYCELFHLTALLRHSRYSVSLRPTCFKRKWCLSPCVPYFGFLAVMNLTALSKMYWRFFPLGLYSSFISFMFLFYLLIVSVSGRSLVVACLLIFSGRPGNA